MTIAHPWVLWATLFSALAVIAAHLLSISRPPELSFPTARFVPQRTVPAVSRASRPTDVLLMLVRLLAVLCAGVAFAGVSFEQSRASVVTLLAVDERVTADTAALRREIVEVARESLRENMQVVGIVSAFGTTPVARPLDVDAFAALPIDTIRRVVGSDSTAQQLASRDPVALSALLLRARRAAPEFAIGADSVRLVVLTPALGTISDAHDEGMHAVRTVWPGRITLRDVAVTSPPAVAMRARDVVTVRGANEDVVRSAFTRWGDLPAVSTRVLRDSMNASDSLAARNGEVVVNWVSRDLMNVERSSRNRALATARVASLAPMPAAPTSAATTSAAVVANGLALIGPLHRTNDLSAHSAQRAIVWWSDGSPAAVEQRIGAGCIRTVGFDAGVGDALLTVPARGVLAALVAPCGGHTAELTRTSANIRQDSLARSERDSMLVGNGALAASAELRASLAMPLSPLTRWLLLSAVACIAFEVALSRISAGSRT